MVKNNNNLEIDFETDKKKIKVEKNKNIKNSKDINDIKEKDKIFPF